MLRVTQDGTIVHVLGQIKTIQHLSKNLTVHFECWFCT